MTKAPPRQQPTVCRICESACGLTATVTDGRVSALAPDRQHPLSKGYACVKGLEFLHVHDHPQRLLRPQMRDQREAPFSSVPWPAALSRVGERLRAIRKKHGPEAIGLFVGNAASQSFGTVLGATALQRALGTRKLYSSLSLDNSEMFVVLDACLGSPMLSFVADYEHSDLVVLLGTDPLQSQASGAQSNPDAIRQLRGVADRGELIVLDPRTSTTARHAHLHLRPRPGSDAPLLAWLCHRALERAGKAEKGAPTPFRDPLLAQADLRRLDTALAPWTLDRVVAATGLSAEELHALDERIGRARRPLVWSGLGLLLGAEGTVAYWLTLCLQALLGGLDREGGWLSQRGAVDVPELWRRLKTPAYDPANKSRIGGYPAVLGALAAATLSQDVLTPGDGQLRALIVVGGNPALSLPDTERTLAALRALDLLVTIDVLPSDTVALSHVALPAADWLEREEVGLLGAHLRPFPHLQRVPAVVPPRAEALPDYAILTAIARAASRPRFGSWLAELGLRTTGWGPTQLSRAAVEWSAPFSWEDLVKQPYGLYAGGSPLGSLRAKGTPYGDRKVHLAPELFVARLAGSLTAPMPAPEMTLTIPLGGALAGASPPVRFQLLTSVRPIETMNSWLHDRPDAARRAPRLTVALSDATRLMVGDGDLVLLRRAGESRWRVEVRVHVDPGLHEGVAVLPFGWGHLDGAVGGGAERGGEARGVNANELISVAVLEPITGQPQSNGAWVEAMKAPTS